MAVRLSLVLAYLEWASDEADEPREISVAHFGKAAHLVEAYLLPMARRAYADASASKGERAARRLVDLIREEGWRQFTARQVMRSQQPSLRNADDLNPALKLLEDADIIAVVPQPENAGRGRPTRMFTVNPIVHRRSI